MTKIYTRTGDKGKTSLMGGKRVLKSDPRVEAYGTVDELNSTLGLAITHLPKDSDLASFLTSVQHDLFAIGSYLSDPAATDIPGLDKKITKFEQVIDEQTQKLPALRNFILPGGSVAGASLHHVRTVCRRAERRVVAFHGEHPIQDDVVTYLNRLSDLLFSSARFINHEENQPETLWKK